MDTDKVVVVKLSAFKRTIYEHQTSVVNSQYAFGSKKSQIIPPPNLYYKKINKIK